MSHAWADAKAARTAPCRSLHLQVAHKQKQRRVLDEGPVAPPLTNTGSLADVVSPPQHCRSRIEPQRTCAFIAKASDRTPGLRRPDSPVAAEPSSRFRPEESSARSDRVGPI